MLVEIVRKKMSRNPQRSIRKMAKDLQESRCMIDTIVRDGLSLKPCRMRRRYLIAEVSKKKLLDRTKTLLQAMRSPGAKVFIWLDEKICTAEPQVNGQKDRILAASSASIDPPVRTAFCSQKPSGAVV